LRRVFDLYPMGAFLKMRPFMRRCYALRIKNLALVH
jgi:hypothetical protein